MSIVITFLALGLSIFVHELGHFLAARRAGVHVEVFSIGLGPQMWTFYTDAKGTHWSLSLFPMGGYVKLLEEATEDGKQIPFPKASLSNKLAIVSAGVISNVLFAYCLICIALVIGIPMTSTTVGKIVPQSPADIAGIRAGQDIVEFDGKFVQSWEDLSLHIALAPQGQPVSITVREETGEKKSLQVTPTRTLYGANHKTPYNEIGIVFSLNSEIAGVHPAYQKIFPLGSKIQKLSLKNPFSAEIIDPLMIQEILTYAPAGAVFSATLFVKGKTITTEDFSPPKISQFIFPFFRPVKVSVVPHSFANKIMGLQEGDIVKSIDKEQIVSKTQLIHALKWSILQRDLQKNYTQNIPITVLRDQKKLDLQISGKTIQTDLSFFQKSYKGTVGIVPYDDNTISSVQEVKGVFFPINVGDNLVSVKEKRDRFVFTYKRNEIEQTTYIGKNLLNKEDFCTTPFNLGVKTAIVQYSLPQAMIQGIYRTSSGMRQNAVSFLKLAKGDIPLDQLGGPVRTFVIFKNAASHRGICYFLLLVAQLGFSLALLNFLPIPALDGGHAMLILLEAARGKPLNNQQMAIFNLMGLTSILLLFFLAMYNDLSWLGVT